MYKWNFTMYNKLLCSPISCPFGKNYEVNVKRVKACHPEHFFSKPTSRSQKHKIISDQSFRKKNIIINPTLPFTYHKVNWHMVSRPAWVLQCVCRGFYQHQRQQVAMYFFPKRGKCSILWIDKMHTTFITFIETYLRRTYYNLIAIHRSFKVDTWINHLKRDTLNIHRCINLSVCDQAASRTG
jgi:hypothetical protein